MSRATRSAIAAAVLLMIVGVLLPDGSERMTPTSFGTYPHGYRAVFELLMELGFPVRRSFDPPDRIAAGSSVWWIAPGGLCVGEEETAPWQLDEFLEKGGTAVVYMAEQQRPVRRKVALKIIKPGMDTKAVVARFEAERQALALMDHANIARVLDGGATESGRPYFVMELVKGGST